MYTHKETKMPKETKANMSAVAERVLGRMCS